MIKLFNFFALWLVATFAPSPAASPLTEIKSPEQKEQKMEEAKEHKIQVALLLDTSGSMDGLIEQAKSQLWKMVNELATAKKDGKAPYIEIALYEYGKDSYAAEDGYLKQLTELTTDLDLVSEKLFELTTNGGSEYCGWAINDAVEDLAWSKSNNDLKLIFIAGNEGFTQGTVDYKDACKKSITNGIMVNTIFCGNCEQGVKLLWKDGADRADGKYMCINTNEKVVHIDAPQDEKIVELNNKLNKTYIAYGNAGKKRKMRQEKQDENAKVYSRANAAERAISKSSNAYRNSSWDVVDAYEDDADEVLEMKEEALPEEMKGMDKKEREAFIKKKAEERKVIQEEIKVLSDERKKFIAAERKKMSGNTKNTLDEVMLDAVREQATSKKFKFEKK